MKKSPANKLTLDIVKNFCSKYQLVCLEKEYNSLKNIMGFNCLKCNHKFKARLASIFQFVTKNNNYNCPQCRKNDYLQNIKNKIKKTNIKLLSSNYFSEKEPLIWKCTNNHVFSRNWEKTYNSLNKKSNLCIICNMDYVFTHSKLDKLIKKSRLKIKLINVPKIKNKFLIQCLKCKKKSRKEIRAIKKSIKNNKDKYCCDFNCRDERNKKYNVSILNNILINKKSTIKIISKKYINGITDLECSCSKCSNNFFITWKRIKNNQYRCPSCSKKFSESHAEVFIRNFLETHYKRKFSKTNPNWLINPLTGKRLEIDCFNKSMNLAVEVNGIFHYKIVSATGRKLKSLIKTKKRDKIKRKIIRSKGIILIVLDTKRKTNNQIKNDLIKQLKKYNLY